MITDDELRERFDLATREVPGSPDLATSIGRGRRIRRRRRAGLVGGSVAGVAAAAVVAGIALGGSGTGPDPVATDRPRSGPVTPAGAEDFVAGTEHDALLEQTIARHLPSLPRPEDVYPSDWDHRGPMPDADFADATDWQATYTVSPQEDLLVITGYAPPDEEADPGCPVEDGTDRAPCAHVPVSGGGWIMDDGYPNDGAYEFFSMYRAPSGFTVSVNQHVTAGSWQQALDRRAFAPEELRALITDAALPFPLPASRR